jgi:hypothetical protein
MYGSCTTPVKIIKNDKAFFEENVELNILDKAEIDIPFTPDKVKAYGTPYFRVVKWKGNKIIIKGIEKGSGRVVLTDNDGVRLGVIKIDVNSN